ncbi:MAG TPA: hypothetical protein VMR73_01425, partial [Candidatus Paceibacterota bacterium]|nr:hypothetical protein [Candidatus Paceibacterota bacterium]
IVLLTGMNPSSEIVNAVGIAPARRDSLSVTPGDAYKATFWQSAITAKTWTDPDETTTDGIFSRMVQSVTSGAASVSDAVNTANSSLQTLLLSQ